MDVKFLERIPGTKKRLYQFTAIDDCTRIRVLKIYDACNQTASVDFANEVIRRLPFRIQLIQTDNGSEFGSHFHWHLEKLDIRHVRIRPRTPRLNGKVERSHRIDNDELYRLLDKGGISDDIHRQQEGPRMGELLQPQPAPPRSVVRRRLNAFSNGLANCHARPYCVQWQRGPCHRGRTIYWIDCRVRGRQRCNPPSDRNVGSCAATFDMKGAVRGARGSRLSSIGLEPTRAAPSRSHHCS